MPQKSGLSREVVSQKRLVYMLNGQQVPNLLVCHERVAAHESGLSKEVLLYFLTFSLTFLTK